MPKRSKSYNPSTHGTGWKTGHPTDAEVRFLNNANVDNNDKVKFMLYGSDSGGFSVRGNTSDNSTYFTFIRLGDT